MKRRSCIKIIIPITVLIILFLVLFLVLFPANKQEIFSGELTLVVNESTGDVYDLNKFLLNMYISGNDVSGAVVVNGNDDYLDYMYNGLSSENSEDIYYTVFSSQVFDKVLRADNTNYYIDRISRDLPLSFYSFTKRSDSYLYVPITWSPWGIYYNKEIFERLGLEEPETLGELEDICDILLDSSIIPYSMVQKLKWPLTAWFDYVNIRKNGVGFHNQLLDGLIDFSDSRVYNVFFYIYNMIQSGYFYQDDEYQWTNMIDTIEEEKTAMVLGGAFYYENASEDFKKDLGWFPFPLINRNDSYSEVVSSSGYIVNSSSDNLKAVDNFIQYALSNNGQGIIKDYTEFYPVNREALIRMKREDLNSAYDHISGADRLVPSFERNNNSKTHQQFKSSLNMLFRINNKDDIYLILENMERQKVEKLKS